MDEEPIAYSWVCHGEWRLKDEGIGSPLPSISAFLYDAITREKWRGQGVYQALISRSVDKLISQGYENLYLMVSDRNFAAKRAPEKLGFRRTEHYIRSYRLFKVLKFRRDRVAFPDGHCVPDGDDSCAKI